MSFDISLFSNTLFSSLGSVTTAKGIIDEYCKAVVSSNAFEQNDFIYNAKQSAFVYLLCSNVNHSSSDFFTDKVAPKYFARTSFKDLGFQDILVDSDNEVDYCIPMTDECNLAKHIPELMNDIMSDYVNMKQSNVYGLVGKFKDDTEIDKQINLFSSGYFAGVEVCGTDNLYPKTCKMMR